MTGLEGGTAMEDRRPEIGIIGGLGRMGRWFDRFFRDAGYRVLIADRNTAVTPRDIGLKCQVVILSLPMDVFPEVVAEIGPVVPEDAFVTDLCSLKKTQVQCMLDHCRCEVAGTHPLFGPGEGDIRGLRVAMCPGRGKRWFAWWEALLRKQGAETWIVSADEHDRIMAWVQAVNHFILLTLGRSLEEDGMDFHHLMRLGTPSFERQMRIVARLAHQDPELYATIQMANPYTEKALNTFLRHAQHIHDIITQGDRKGFLSVFREVQRLGPILEGFADEKGRKK